MQRVLFHSTIFGPIHSRRLGTSLGINLTPDDGKICSFDCLYCEAGYNAQGPGTTGMADTAALEAELEARLRQMKAEGQSLDVITFSGNGEPTLHRDFEKIVDIVIRLRDIYYPEARISVLSNSTRLADPGVCRALRKVDNNILKLDSAVPATVRLLDRPVDPGFDIERTIGQLGQFAGQAIIQTMLTRGSHEGERVDNTLDREIDALIAAYKRIRPREIMLYTIDRPTPETTLEHVSPAELRAAADRITRETGIPVQVSA